uniref:PfkB family carbohydrate kinase n=1 Tax=Pararhizobium sp. IMCC3301 TaxID=3067904 RepID=UPI00274179CE|nr:PfkB family carbohydrate kinase [Pararhizobium sp. IMCC3301]
MTQFDLIAIGDNCIDEISGQVDAVRVGGNAVNVAVQAALQGLRVAYMGAVGPQGDANGDRVAEALARNGVDIRWLERRERPTAVTRIHVDQAGDRKILYEDFGACTGWQPDATRMNALEGARHVHLGWLNDGGATRQRLVGGDVPVSQDISVNALTEEDIAVEGLTIAFASLPETRSDETENFAADLLKRGAQAAVISLGSHGSFARFGNESYRAQALAITPVDTTGAGDSYITGFLTARLAGASVPDAMHAGHALAAKTCMHPGGFVQ